jgi:hypothetical protein
VAESKFSVLAKLVGRVRRRELAPLCRLLLAPLAILFFCGVCAPVEAAIERILVEKEIDDDNIIIKRASGERLLLEKWSLRFSPFVFEGKYFIADVGPLTVTIYVEGRDPLKWTVKETLGVATPRAGAPKGQAPPVQDSRRGLKVYVIAPSVSTSMEARSIRLKYGWVESPLRRADAVLVVVRSMLFNPLDYSYDSVKELQDDADNQLNIAGENFHVYIYSIDDDMKVTQEKHVSYKARD